MCLGVGPVWNSGSELLFFSRVTQEDIFRDANKWYIIFLDQQAASGIYYSGRVYLYFHAGVLVRQGETVHW